MRFFSMNIDNPLVSIVIPSFNSKPWIEETIFSVLNSTYSHLEIVWVDDHSNDGSLETAIQVLNARQVKHKAVLNPGKGAQSARNYGVRISSGDYIKFLDADDCVSDDLIEKQVCALSNNGDSISKCSWGVFHGLNSSKSVLAHQKCDVTYTSGVDFLADLWDGNMYPPHSWLYPRKLLTQDMIWDESLHQNQDGDFTARIVQKANAIVHTGGCALYRKPTDNNISSRRGIPYINSQIRVLKRYREIALSPSSSREIKSSYNRQVLDIAYRCTCSRTEKPFLNEVIQLLILAKNVPIHLEQSKLMHRCSKLFGVKNTLRIRAFLNAR